MKLRRNSGAARDGALALRYRLASRSTTPPAKFGHRRGEALVFPRRVGASILSRSPPKAECDRKRIDIGRGPPRGLIAIAVQLPVMEATDRDGVFVADLAAERARLGEPNVMRLARPSAADNAGLCGDELAVLLVPQPDSLWRHPTMTRLLPRQYDRRAVIVSRFEERLSDRAMLRRLPQWCVGVGGRFLIDRGSQLNRCELFSNARLDNVGVGRRQRVLGREILVYPSRGLFVRLQNSEVRKELLAERRRFLWFQRLPRRKNPA